MKHLRFIGVRKPRSRRRDNDDRGDEQSESSESKLNRASVAIKEIVFLHEIGIRSRRTGGCRRGLKQQVRVSRRRTKQAISGGSVLAKAMTGGGGGERVKERLQALQCRECEFDHCQRRSWHMKEER